MMKRPADHESFVYPSLPDKHFVGRSFSQAASRYDGVARLQRSVGERLLACLPRLASSPATIIDAGCGTGHFSARLLEVFPDARLMVLDLAEGMLRQAQARVSVAERCWLVRGDVESLPLADGSVDLVFSNLALQWCLDLPGVFAGFRRILRPGGIVLFSSFGAQTLCELRAAWGQVDTYSHVNAFCPMRTVKDALHTAGFGECFVESCVRRLHYPSVDGLMRELKALGAHNVTANRPRHLTAKGTLRKLIAAYEAQMPDGRIRASFEVVQGYARRG
jgi:malonyl-CoA O-methyltransferase